MSHFFYTASSLPQLYCGVQPEITFFHLLEVLEENLSSKEFERVNEIREFLDVLNIKRLLKGQAIDNRGVKTEKELDRCVVECEGFHSAVLEFLYTYESREERLKHFTELLSSYLVAKSEETSGFTRKYFYYERLLRLSLVGYRCAKRGGDIVEELKFEDPRDPFVASLIAQKDTTHFEFPFELEELTEQLVQARNPIDEYRVLFEHQFAFAEGEGQNSVFSLDYLLAYLVQLIAVENWEATSEETGKGIIEGMV